MDELNRGKLQEIIEHFLGWTGVHKAYILIFPDDEGQESIDVYISFISSKEYQEPMTAIFRRGVFIDGSFWHMTNRAFSARGSLVFWDFTLQKGRFDNEKMQRQALMPVLTY